MIIDAVNHLVNIVHVVADPDMESGIALPTVGAVVDLAGSVVS